VENKAPDSELIPVPYNELSPKALTGLIESFVSREGTDYGDHEFSLEQKVAHVLKQLERGDVLIVFDPKEESFDIRRKL